MGAETYARTGGQPRYSPYQVRPHPHLRLKTLMEAMKLMK